LKWQAKIKILYEMEVIMKKYIVVKMGLAISTLIFSLAAQAQGGSKDIKIVLATVLDTVEPCNMMTTSDTGIVLRQNIVESLTQMDPKNSTALPLLATSWKQMDESASTWRITLRKGVKYHDGSDFNAEAVASAINRLFSPQLGCRDRIRLFGKNKLTPKVVDANTIDIISDQPLPLMPSYLAQIGMTSPKMDSLKLTRQPIGTGPYVLASWDPAQNLVVKRFEGYWGKKPEVQQATYVWRSEPALRASMVAVGEADIGTAIALQDATNPKTDFSYLNSETTRIRMLSMAPPLNDVRVRKALNLAINRQAFIGTVLSPGVVPATQYMLPNIAGHNPALKVWPYDPNQAKQLLKEARAAGVPVDKEIILYGGAHQHANAAELLESMVKMWQDVGLNVTLKMIEKVQFGAIRRKPYAENRPPTLFHEQHDNSSGDAIFTLLVYYHSTGQLSDLADPKIDQLLDEGSKSTGDKRRRLFQEANRIIQQQIIPDVMLYHMADQIRVSTRLEYHPNFTTGGKLELSDIKFKNDIK
jgi:peptide/nickel transport system substrate-binding protein